MRVAVFTERVGVATYHPFNFNGVKLMFKKNDFIARKPDIIRHFKKKGVTSSSIAEYCALSGIPIVVTCGFIMDEMPEHYELCKNKIDEINEFFGVKNF